MSENKKHSDGWIARCWWSDLQPNSDNPKAPRGNPKALAMLRRAHSWVDAAAVPETMVLFRKLEKKDERWLPRVSFSASISFSRVSPTEFSSLAALPELVMASKRCSTET